MQRYIPIGYGRAAVRLCSRGRRVCRFSLHYSVGAAALAPEERQRTYFDVQQIIHEEQLMTHTVYPDELQSLSAVVTIFPQASYRDALGCSHLIVKSK